MESQSRLIKAAFSQSNCSLVRVNHRVSLTLRHLPKATQYIVMLQGGPLSDVLFDVLGVVPLASLLAVLAKELFVRGAF